ncbi:uncharacterized protein LOC109717616 [Ananas comosus]|uniref:Uncharacterized protein LOC109717616 n=1 Tax=Ananas comosus TaxID=4615 RepID=A0A6P5G1E6_ANACO|nr:uncharacterized protein LOC109717616 [Ananas comosus]
MAVSINSCLKPISPAPPNPSPQTLTAPIQLWPMNKDVAATWRRRCVSAAACVIISSTSSGIMNGIDGAAAAVTAFAGDHVTAHVEAVAGPPGKEVRWSDVRKCPPWHENSLENIMPENLPRPSDRRRYNSVVAGRTAPGVAGYSVVRYNTSCYSM